VPPSEQPGPAAGILARGYAFVVVGLRYVIVGAWAAAVVLAILFLQPLSAASSTGLSDAVRSLLVPALVALFGRLGMWPGNRRVPEAAVSPPVTPPARVSSGDQS
jgi:uncharacterized membrane protein YdfJ with MMPL/SSD domain